ncbi:MAG: hypothetical protein IKY67_06190 [Paludibacteraceae bacterium]|nr:hypothetical protein [Paludibacteraceae bacterium]
MIRGTTPSLTFNLPFDVSNIKTVWVTFSQKHFEVLSLETEQLQLKGQTISVKLTQDQTLSLKQDEDVEIQLRILTNNGDALASNIMRTSADRILREGVIA